MATILNMPTNVGSTSLTQPQIAYINVIPESPRIGKQYANIYRYLGISEVALGSLSIVFQISLLCISGLYRDYMAFVSDGIWCGALFVASGILGIVSGSHPTACPIIAGMVLSGVSALFATTMLGIQIAAAIIARFYSYSDVPVALHSVMCVFAFAEFIIAILHSSYCCAATCCRSERNAQPVYLPQTAHTNQMQPVYMPGQSIATMRPGQMAGFAQPGQQQILNCHHYQAAHFAAPAMEMRKNQMTPG